MIGLYIWKAKDERGKLYQGRLQASSTSEAVAFVRSNYGYVLSLQVEREHGLSGLLRRLLHQQIRFSDKQRVVFFTQLSVVLNSGIPIFRGMELLQHRTSGKVGQACKNLAVGLNLGMPFAAAMEQSQVQFSSLAITLVKAGEQSGDLQLVLAELAKYYQKQAELKQFLVKSALYPCFLLLMSLGVLCFFLAYVLPMLADVYRSMGVKPAEFLLTMVRLQGYLSEYGAVLVVLVLIAVVAIAVQRKAMQGLLCRLPWVRKLYGAAVEIRLNKLLALLLERGIPITEAVELAMETVAVPAWRRQLYVFNALLRRGEGIGNAAQQVELVFSPLTLELISIGAETGYLPQMLNEAATILEQDLRERLERLRELLAPLLLLVAALVVGAVVCSVVSPLFDLFTALPDG